MVYCFQLPPVADSFTLTLGNWLGIPGLPMVVSFHRKNYYLNEVKILFYDILKNV